MVRPLDPGARPLEYPSMHDEPPATHGSSPFKGKTGLRRLVNAARYSAQGFASAYRDEAAFRQEVLATVALGVVALLSGASGTGKALMIGSLLLVLVVELLNSAIEAAVDRVSLDRHPLAGQAKDLGSAAVAVALVNVVVIWALVLVG
jgi:diacylglycerol kinase (ATP)